MSKGSDGRTGSGREATDRSDRGTCDDHSTQDFKSRAMSSAGRNDEDE